MKISSLNMQYKTNYNPNYGANNSDWKIQKKDDGVFIPLKRYKFEKFCEYILCGVVIADIIKIFVESKKYLL